MTEHNYRRPIDVGATSTNKRRAQIRRVVRLAGNLMLLGALVLGSMWLWERVRADDRFTVTEIEVEAPARIDERTKAIIESCRGRNLFEIDLAEVTSRLQTIDWVAEASVEKIVPRKLRVRVMEREPVATVVRGDRELWVDESGALFAPDESVLLGDENLPRIDALTRPRTDEALRFLRSLERRDRELAARVSRVTPVAHGQWVIEDRELGTRVIADESDVVAKWRTLYGIAAREGWPRGSVEYADLRFDRQIVVQKFSGLNETERSR